MFKKVLFPTDFSKGSEIAARRFEVENEMEVMHLVLLHVVDESILEELTNGFSMLYNSEEEELNAIESRLKREADAKLKKLAADYKKSFKANDVSIVVEFGIPYKKIAETAKRENVSLIILPSHGKINFSREIFGSTTLRVLKTTQKPVLIIPAVNEE